MTRYIGPWYTVSSGDTRRAGALSLALLVLSAAAFVIKAYLNTPGGRCFYVLPFSLFMMFPLFYWAYGAVQTLLLKPRFTAIQKDEGPDRLRSSALGAAILSGLYTLGDIVFLLLGQAGDRVGTELTGAGLILLIGLCALIVLKGARELDMAKQEPETEPAQVEPQDC